MFVNSFVSQSRDARTVKTVNREVKFWARNGRVCYPSKMIAFDVRINRKFYFFYYHESSGEFHWIGGNSVQVIGSRVPRVYHTIDGMQFCVTAKRLWVKQLGLGG
jgi:hypothetical protein